MNLPVDNYSLLTQSMLATSVTSCMVNKQINFCNYVHCSRYLLTEVFDPYTVNNYWSILPTEQLLSKVENGVPWLSNCLVVESRTYHKTCRVTSSNVLFRCRIDGIISLPALMSERSESSDVYSMRLKGDPLKVSHTSNVSARISISQDLVYSRMRCMADATARKCCDRGPTEMSNAAVVMTHASSAHICLRRVLRGKKSDAELE
jgi:hypothetical protein